MKPEIGKLYIAQSDTKEEMIVKFLNHFDNPGASGGYYQIILGSNSYSHYTNGLVILFPDELITKL